MIHSIYTSRLAMHPLTSADVSFVLNLLNSEGWLKNIGDRGVKTEEQALEYIETKIQKMYRDKGLGTLKIVLRDSGIPIGVCGLIRRDGLEHTDIGFALLPEYSGKGFAKEAAEAVLEDAIRRKMITKIQGITLPSNQASIAVLKHLGLQQKGTIRLPDDPEDLLLFEKDFN